MKDKMKNLKKEKGITLVALIITIIVLLILAIVSIRLVMNGGIIERANKGNEKYSTEEVQEQIKLAYTEWQTAQWDGTAGDATEFITERLQSIFGETNVRNVSVTNGKVIVEIRTTGDFIKYSYDAGTGVAGIVEKWKQNSDGSYSKESTTGVKVGDIVKYETILAKEENAVDSTKLTNLKEDLSTYSGMPVNNKTNSYINRENLTWKVFDIKDGDIRLISSKETSLKIALRSSISAYNNGVHLIDKACDTLYSASGVGKAQNLKIEDIEEKLTYDYTQYENSNVDTGKYGGTKEYTSTSGGLLYPNIYLNEVGCKAVSDEENTNGTLGLSDQNSLVEGYSISSGRLKATQTYWEKELVNSDDFINGSYSYLIWNSGCSYWLSSRCVLCTGSRPIFRFRYMRDGNKVSAINFYSDGYDYDDCIYSFRPVVTLKSDVKLSGSSASGWTIQ